MTTPREQAEKAVREIFAFLFTAHFPNGRADDEREIADLILSHLWAPAHLPDPPKEKP